jgi:hypothetical protein
VSSILRGRRPGPVRHAQNDNADLAGQEYLTGDLLAWQGAPGKVPFRARPDRCPINLPRPPRGQRRSARSAAASCARRHRRSRSEAQRTAWAAEVDRHGPGCPLLRARWPPARDSRWPLTEIAVPAPRRYDQETGDHTMRMYRDRQRDLTGHHDTRAEDPGAVAPRDAGGGHPAALTAKRVGRWHVAVLAAGARRRSGLFRSIGTGSPPSTGSTGQQTRRASDPRDARTARRERSARARQPGSLEPT